MTGRNGGAYETGEADTACFAPTGQTAEPNNEQNAGVYLTSSASMVTGSAVMLLLI